MNLLPLLGFLLLFINPVSAVKITSVTSVPYEMNDIEGSRLIIPCQFHTDKPSYGHHIRVEWGVIPSTQDSYKPLIYRHNLKVIEYLNMRAKVFNRLVDRGNCSLAIDPIMVKDTGVYQLHISVDGAEYTPVPVVAINVFEEEEFPHFDTANRQHQHRSKRPQNNMTPLIIVGGLCTVLVLTYAMYKLCRYLDVESVSDISNPKYRGDRRLQKTSPSSRRTEGAPGIGPQVTPSPSGQLLSASATSLASSEDSYYDCLTHPDTEAPSVYISIPGTK